MKICRTLNDIYAYTDVQIRLLSGLMFVMEVPVTFTFTLLCKE